MKKGLVSLLIATMFLMVLVSCGSEGSGNVAPKETEKSKATEAVIDQGYWVTEKVVMEGTEFEGEDLEGIFGPADSVLSMEFKEDGTFGAILFEDYIHGTYTGSLESFEIQIEDQKYKGSCSEENKMILEMEEGSQFVLVNQNEMPDAIANNPWATYSVEFDAAATCKMNTFMGYGRYLVTDDVVYGLTHAQTNDGCFGAIPFHMVGDFPEFDEAIILDDRGVAYYIDMYEDYLYYILEYNSICRVHPDGTGLETLYEGACDYLQIFDGKLYFTNEDYHFVSMELDGTNVEKVVEKEIYYPYLICEDWMIFQDDADDESLHLYNVRFGEELNINYIPSLFPVIDGHYLYYTERCEGGYGFARIDMSDPYTFLYEISDEILTYPDFLIDEEYIYTANNTSVLKEDWKDLKGPEGELQEVYLFISEDYKLYVKYDSEGYITEKYLMSKERNGGTSFK